MYARSKPMHGDSVYPVGQRTFFGSIRVRGADAESFAGWTGSKSGRPSTDRRLRADDRRPTEGKGNGRVGGLPDRLRSGLEQLSGFSMAEVKVHYNSPEPAHLGAVAKTQGSEIHLAPGAAGHLPHEAWHVVQQAQGRVRPTMNLNEQDINDQPALEREATVMGTRAARLQAPTTTTAAVQMAPDNTGMGYKEASFRCRHLSPPSETRSCQSNKLVRRDNETTNEPHPTFSMPCIANDHRSRKPESPSACTQMKRGFDIDLRDVSYTREQKLDSQMGKMAQIHPGAVTSEGADGPRGLDDEEKAILVKEEIDHAIVESYDTTQLLINLEGIKARHALQEMKVVNIGTPSVAVKYKINPWFIQTIPSGAVIYQMSGRGTPAITEVKWATETLTIGAGSAMVGMHMVANPLGPDYEHGSTSSDDSDQDKLMAQLVNAGNTAVPNDQKYIKGHLLNDHVGGPGRAFNLFPITADANAKHLAYVEKFVKAQLLGSNVIYYEIKVDHSAPVSLSSNNTVPYYINADFNFHWHTLDMSAQKMGSEHTGKIESQLNATGAAPFDVTLEYANLFSSLNTSKITPTVISQSNQWQVSGITQQTMAHVPMPTTILGTLGSPVGLIGQPATSSFPDLSGRNINTDSSGVEFVSVRTTEPILSNLSVGATIIVGPGNNSHTDTVKQISPVSGGWVRIYI